MFQFRHRKRFCMILRYEYLISYRHVNFTQNPFPSLYLLYQNQFFLSMTNEPRHDKTNKLSVRPAKTQISLGIRPVWSESSLCAHWVAKDQAFFMRTTKTLIRQGGCPGWSESSRGAHSFCWFCHVAAHMLWLICWWINELHIDMSKL